MNKKIIKRRPNETQADFELRVDVLLADVDFISVSYVKDENGESDQAEVLYF
ncbi:hypothetical protein ACXGSF_05215 [Limosilactobacillus mucosae]